jgi:hypothetical protein
MYGSSADSIGVIFLTMSLTRKVTVLHTRPTSSCILFDCKNISFDATLVMYINITNIHPIMIINTIYEHQNLLSL